jgi:two-component system KDP operon response regulator KdpE
MHRMLADDLKAAGYVVSLAADIGDAVRVVSATGVSLMLLDSDVLGAEKFEGITRLRRVTSGPLILLHGSASIDERTAALDSGADDCVTTPPAISELHARIRALLRRSSPAMLMERVQRIGEIELDRDTRLVRVNGESVKLTPREWELLLVLAQRTGQVVTQQELLTTVWGARHRGNAQYLRVYVGHLRRKLGPAASLLQTIAGIGFRLGFPK